MCSMINILKAWLMNNAKRHLPVFRLSLFLCVLLALALACSDDEQGQKETPPVTTGSDTRA